MERAWYHEQRVGRAPLVGLDGDFLEVHRGCAVVVLQANIARIGTRTANRLIPGMPLRNRLISDESVDDLTVQLHDGLLPFESDIHGVPLTSRFLVAFGHFAERVKRAG